MALTSSSTPSRPPRSTSTSSATQEHLDVLRGSVPRNLLLWCALEQICAEAGRRVSDPASIKKRLVPEPSQQRARRALDVVLLDPETAVERYFASEDVDTQRLIAHGADPELLCEGALFAALGENPSAEWKRRLVEEEQARRRGDAHGVVRGGRLQSIALRLWGRVSRPL